jgi:hypothetical protein
MIGNNFIGQYYLEDISICDRIIEFYETNPNLVNEVYLKNKDVVFKDCYQIASGEVDNELIHNYEKQLQGCLDKYLDTYIYANDVSIFKIRYDYNLQHYKPSQSYSQWHAERNGNGEEYITRHLVFMTYLNDVNDEGETEWFYQKIKVKPKKGLTVIWPAEWTHTHKGIPSRTEDKFILTGWFNFI